MALEGRGFQESWSLFKHHFLHAQDRCVRMSKKSSKGGRRPAWMSKELLVKRKWKRKVYGMWKEGQATWEEYRNVVRACRETMRKAEAHLELNLARDVKDNKKDFSSKQKTRKNVGLLLNEVGALVMGDAVRVELLNAFFASVFSAKTSPQASQSLEVREKAWRKEDLLLVEKDWVRDHLSKLDIYKSMGLDGMQPRVLRELADVITKPLSIIFERSWRTEGPENWRKASVTPVFKKGKKEDQENYRLISLTSISGKVIEQLILDVIIKQVEEKKVIRSSQHGFTKGKSCLTNLIPFYDGITG